MKKLTCIITFFLIALSATQHPACGAALPETDLAWKNVALEGRANVSLSMLLDSKGMMWIGSNNGLSYYDGITTHPIKDAALAGAQIYAMAEYGGTIYLGTNNGLLKLDITRGTLSQFGKDTPKEIRAMQIIDGTIWVGSLYGVFSVSTKDGSISDYSEGLPHQSVYSLLRDSRGIIYAGTYNGLARWDAAKKRFAKINSAPSSHRNNNLFVNCMMESDDNTCLYIGCEGALYKYHIAGEQWEDMPAVSGNNVKSIARMGPDHLLIGTDNGLYDCINDTIRHYRHDSRQVSSLAGNEIWCILTDSDSNVWAGHDRGFSVSSHSGILRAVRLSSMVHSGDGNEIFAILRDSKGNMWLGGTNGVILLTKDGEAQWHRHSNASTSLSHNRIRSIYEDKDGTIWLATDGGLNRYNASGGFDIFSIVDSEGEHNANWTYTVAQMDSSYWVGGFLGGIHRVAKSKFDGKERIVASDFTLNAAGGNDKKDTHRLENDLINNIVVDNDGNLWILLFRDNILACYNPRTDNITRHNIHTLTGRYPLQISKDRKGRIWCAFNGGAAVFALGKKPSVIHFAGNSDDESVVSLAPVGNDMWVSTYSNTWRIDGNTLQASILPLPQKEYTVIYEDTLTGNVLLGSVDEILEADPASLPGMSGAKKVNYIATGIDNGLLIRFPSDSEHERLVLPYGGNLSLTVSALDYSPQAVHRYMYKLAASATDTAGNWSLLPEGVNTILLTDLKPGKYDLLIKRVGMSGAAVSIPLTVNPPLWLQWWAIMFYIIILTAVIAAIVLYYRRKSRRQIYENERRKSLENVERKLTFLSNISHDLKTPLSMILGPVSLLREKMKDNEAKQHLETIYNNAVRLNNMIHKTIELEHAEDGSDTMLILSTFDIVDFCKGVFESFKENNPQKRFVFHASCSGIFVEADAVKFESVMTNLLSNACKYSDEGATVSCGVNLNGDNVEIVVSDDGLGIEEIDQPLVFNRMFRSPDAAKMREGSGIGLYLIKKYLEMMKGTINLYSRKGQGTSFIVTLPVAKRAETQQNAGESSSGIDRPKILVVEDNSEISTFISNLLSKDYTVLAAENGRSGLAIASSFFPDLIIADEMMPIMSGLEMCRRLKQIPRLNATPIIMLTAKTDTMTENESIKLGVDIFMTKPFEPGVLLSRIKQLLKLRCEIRENIRIEAITETKPIEAESVSEKQLARISKIIEENISDPDLNVNMLCEKCGMPQKQLYRLVKKYMGAAPLDYIRRVRLQKAAMLLGQQRFTVSEICYMVGFKTPSYFAKCFAAQYGVTPSQYHPD